MSNRSATTGVPLEVGERLTGPLGEWEILRVQLEGYPQYDGGLPGVAVRVVRGPSRVRKWFVPGSDEDELRARILRHLGTYTDDYLAALDTLRVESLEGA